MAESALVDLVEHAYALECDERAWLEGLSDLVTRVYGAPRGAFTYAYAIDAADRPTLGTQVHRSGVPTRRLLGAMFEQATPEVVRYFFRFGPPSGSIVDAVDQQAAPQGLIATARDLYHGTIGMKDLFVLNVRGRADRAVHVNLPIPEPLGRSSDAQRRRWGRVVAHLSAGLRLRDALRDLAEPEAILDPAGARLHAEGPAKGARAAEALREAVRARERARGPLRRDRPDRALEIWQGLVEGRWSLVDRFESDGRRFVVARRNEPSAVDPRALTRREQQVASLVARGMSTKLIGYELGLSVGAVGGVVQRLIRKLGARNRTDLIALIRSLSQSKTGTESKE